MLRTTPLKNSKSVNKPFKSPFDSAAQKKEQTKLFNKDRVVKQDDVSVNSPLSSRYVISTKLFSGAFVCILVATLVLQEFGSY